MILSDNEIKRQINDGELLRDENGEIISSPDVSNISYDLSTKSFYSKELGIEGATEFTLKPLDSVFVASSEIINLPHNVSAEVKLKYGLMTDGLLLDAPLYQPGHHGSHIFFRLTNISNKEIQLTIKKKYAYILFHKTEKVSSPYNGDFCNSQKSITEIREHSYKGVYLDIVEDINKTREDINKTREDINKTREDINKTQTKMNNAEKTIYGNVLVIITVFITLFSLLSSFFSSSNGNTTVRFTMISLLLGSIFALIGAVCVVIENDKSWYKKSAILWCLAIAFFGIAFYLNMQYSSNQNTGSINESNISDQVTISPQTDDTLKPKIDRE